MSGLAGMGVILALVLVSCTSAPVPDALQAYGDVARFLLRDARSLSFQRSDLGQGDAALPVLRARCARAFDQPHGGYGPYQGVEAWDFGTGGTAKEWIARDPGWQPVAPIRGMPSWFARDERRNGTIVIEHWLAIVDDRFVVASNHRDLLERALSRSSRLDQLLDPFPAVGLLPASAEAVLCLLPRPDDQPFLASSLMPTEPLVLCVPSGQRLTFLHQDALPDVVKGMATDGSTRTTARRGGYLVTELDLPGEANSRDLMLDLLFGLKIFI